ncbi:MAG TPA: hypothetical protein VFQ44_09880 [Streptosporangiaceae bacterium]|nr:hypothetical protein [Streptosporangiaceae bacterium]
MITVAVAADLTHAHHWVAKPGGAAACAELDLVLSGRQADRWAAAGPADSDLVSGGPGEFAAVPLRCELQRAALRSADRNQPGA